MRNIRSTSVHHKIAKQLWGSNHHDNLIRMDETVHNWQHMRFWNDLPHEQILDIVDVTGKCFKKCFTDDVIEVVSSYDLEEIYKDSCYNTQKLVNFILNRDRIR